VADLFAEHELGVCRTRISTSSNSQLAAVRERITPRARSRSMKCSNRFDRRTSGEFNPYSIAIRWAEADNALSSATCVI